MTAQSPRDKVAEFERRIPKATNTATEGCQGWRETKRMVSGEDQSWHAVAATLTTDRCVRLFGIDIAQIDFERAVSIVMDMALGLRVPGFVVTPNVDHIVSLSTDARLQDAYARASLTFADGQPLIWASRLLGFPLPERITGADLLPAICERAASTGATVFFLGGEPGVGENASTLLTHRFPGLRVAGTYAPPFGFDSVAEERAKVIQIVNQAQPDILFVGFGAPRQEYWAAETFGLLNTRVVLCTGAALDFAAGHIQRAPEWMRRSGLEWLYRLIREPRRLWKRYLLKDLRFAPILLEEWRSHRRSLQA